MYDMYDEENVSIEEQIIYYIDNEEDTEYAIDENHEITKINVSIHFIQKKSA